MRLEKIVGLCVLAAAIGAGLALQLTAPARAAAPIVRANYQGIGDGVNANVAVVWLLGSDGSLQNLPPPPLFETRTPPFCGAPVTP